MIKFWQIGLFQFVVLRMSGARTTVMQDDPFFGVGWILVIVVKDVRLVLEEENAMYQFDKTFVWCKS